MLLITDRLMLREFKETDFEAFASLVANHEVMRFSLKKGPLSKEEARGYFQRRALDQYTKYGFGLWAVFEKGGENLIGFAGLVSEKIDEQDEVSVGFRFDPKYWGKGYATEITQAICRYAFDVLKIPQLICIINRLNFKSLKVAERVGMKFWKEANFYGTAVQVFILRGSYD